MLEPYPMLLVPMHQLELPVPTSPVQDVGIRDKFSAHGDHSYYQQGITIVFELYQMRSVSYFLM
jgi:hypothetical protein